MSNPYISRYASFSTAMVFTSISADLTSFLHSWMEWLRNLSCCSGSLLWALIPLIRSDRDFSKTMPNGLSLALTSTRGFDWLIAFSGVLFDGVLLLLLMLLLLFFAIFFRSRIKKEQQKRKNIAFIENKQEMHSRQPSLDSRTFAVPPPAETPPEEEAAAEEEEDNETSTDSYDDLDEQEQETACFQPHKYLNDTLQSALTSLEFNRSMALQAQTSGRLRGKELELIALQQEAQRKLGEFQTRFTKGGKVLQQVAKDLKWSHAKVQQLTSNVQSKYPVEYSQAKDKVINRGTTLADKEEDEIYI